MVSRASSIQSGKAVRHPKKKAVRIRKEEQKKEAFRVLIGPPKLTRFEKARIIGARALQLSLGAPPFMPIPPQVKDPITLATLELESKALPISIRRSLPNGSFQDIAVDALL